jgi:thioredoxin 1
MNNLSLSQFDSEVIASKVPVIIDIGAEWCPPCRALKPMLEKIAASYGDKAKFLVIDADTESKLVEKFSVSSLPTILFFSGGVLKKTVVGMQGEAFLRATIDAL